MRGCAHGVVQRTDDIRSGSGPLPGLRAGAVIGFAVIGYVLVAWHLQTVPQNNEPENVRSSIQHLALMAVLVIVTFVAAVVAVVQGASGGGKRSVVRAVPILVGLLGLVAAAVSALVIFASLLATRDV